MKCGPELSKYAFGKSKEILLTYKKAYAQNPLDGNELVHTVESKRAT